MALLRHGLLAMVVIAAAALSPAAGTTVSYDHKAIVIGGQRRILFSGSIHYPRSTPEMWPELIQKAKDGGLDVIQTYVFWSGHEPVQGQYYFEDRYDLVRFVKAVQSYGLYVNLRIGPYVCAEWNFGGFPVWLKFVPGISFRTDNGPFKAAMETFTTKIVSMMKSEGLFASQGGPIILAQVENEFGPMEPYVGPGGHSYAVWAANMAVGLGTGVPWVMCKQDDAPDPIINTCNGFYCTDFEPNRSNKPKMWTELWTGWFTAFGGTQPYRPAEDTAYAVASFIQSGGSFVNYYMYHGGTNFDRTSGGPFIATSYDYDAPIDEYGLLRQPKWGHLKDLHKAIKQCEPALVSGDPTVSDLGSNAKAYVYKSTTGACAAFLSNPNSGAATITFNGVAYSIPAWSSSILPDCKTVVFNTATVNAPTLPAQMTKVGGFSWSAYTEDFNSLSSAAFTKNGLVEQLGQTWDRSDFLWYTTVVNVADGEGFLASGKWPQLTINSAGHALQLFVNGKPYGYGTGGYSNSKLSFYKPINLWKGSNKISILSSTVGLPNVGTHYENWNMGVLGPVTLSGLNEGTRDLSRQQWTYQVGLTGESLGLPKGSGSVSWKNAYADTPLTWYKAYFDAPAGNDPLALDMSSMKKGQIWINGRNIGRHWSAYTASGNCGGCSYVGTFSENKCQTGCGQPSQRWYHVPRSWLNPTGNLIVVLEEWGGDPSGITLVKRTV